MKCLKVALVALLAAIPLMTIDRAGAATTAQFSLTPSSQTVTTGDTITLDLNLNTGGNSVLAWKANLTYSTSAFSSVTVAPNSSAHFTLNPSSDVSSGGVIRLARYATTASSSNSTLATITLKSSGVGSTAVNFAHICSSTADSTPCSAVTDSTGANLLANITGGNYTVSAVPVAGTSAKTTKKKGLSGIADTISSALNSLIAPSAGASETKSDIAGTNVVKLTIFDQNSDLVPAAAVELAGASGKTNKNGEVVLTGLAAGNAKGSISFKDQTFPISLKVEAGTSLKSPQVARLNIKIASGSILPSILLGLIGFSILAIIVVVILKIRGNFNGKLSGFIPHRAAAPPQQLANPIKPIVNSPPPATFVKPSSASLLRHEPMKPGSVVRPNSLDSFNRTY